jgi:hypothetical protein
MLWISFCLSFRQAKTCNDLRQPFIFASHYSIQKTGSTEYHLTHRYSIWHLFRKILHKAYNIPMNACFLYSTYKLFLTDVILLWFCLTETSHPAGNRACWFVATQQWRINVTITNGHMQSENHIPHHFLTASIRDATTMSTTKNGSLKLRKIISTLALDHRKTKIQCSHQVRDKAYQFTRPSQNKRVHMDSTVNVVKPNKI